MGGTDITSTAYSSGTISIAAVTGDLVISVTAAEVTVELVSISAAYTQSGTVYDTDSLDSLKTDLVVTATYDDTSSATVPAADYTLSGTLTAGTSTITVTYGGKTTTFTVTVTAAPQPATVTMSEFVSHNSISGSGFKLYSDGGTTEYSDNRFPVTNGRTSVSNVINTDATIKITFTPSANSFQCWLFGSTNFDNSVTLASGNGNGYWLKYITPSSDVFAYGWSSESHVFTASVKAGDRFMIMAHPSAGYDISAFTVEVV